MSALGTSPLGLCPLFCADLGSTVGDQLICQAHPRGNVREHAAHLLGRLAATLDNGFVCLGGVGHSLMVSAGVEATSIRGPWGNMPFASALALDEDLA